MLFPWGVLGGMMHVLRDLERIRKKRMKEITRRDVDLLLGLCAFSRTRMYPIKAGSTFSCDHFTMHAPHAAIHLTGIGRSRYVFEVDIPTGG
jgi:hypothetical protein